MADAMLELNETVKFGRTEANFDFWYSQSSCVEIALAVSNSP